MIETFQQELPHGISLSCRAAGDPGRPVLVFLHGFPEAAFIWDELLEHFSRPENGGYRCIAPNLRGFENSSHPTDPKLYRPRHLVQDIAALIELQESPIECLVAHDWGGAVAWNVANQHPQLLRKLAIVNSPHPGTFLRELKNNPAQQAASAYMNFLVRPDAEKLLSEDDYRRLFGVFTRAGVPGWLTESARARYRDVWDRGLTGALNYYRASPLRPARQGDDTLSGVELPREMLTIEVPVLVVWAMEDVALLPSLVDGLDEYIDDLTIERIPGATHWIVHEQPRLLAGHLGAFLRRQ